MQKSNDSTKIIKIKCEGAATQELDSLTVLQGNLKKLSKQNLTKLKSRITNSGFCAPFFIWDRDGELMILDGTQRRAALLALRAEGWTIPPLPVVYIHSDTEAEARTILLSISSQYGEWVEEELAAWLAGVDAEIRSTLREVDGEIELVDIGNIQEFKTGLSEKNIEPYKRVHVLLSMSQDVFFEVQDDLKNIKQVEGVEYEQSQN
jgi:hypothetical protein